MKKYIAVSLIIFLILTLVSCDTPQSPQNFFDYQNNFNTYEGKWQEGENTYEVSLKISEYEKSITFIAPESIAGMCISLEGENYAISIEGISIPLQKANGEKLLRLLRLFELQEEDIVNISTKDENTVATGKNENASWSVTTDRKGVPLKLEYTDSLGIATFTVDKAGKL